MSCGLAKPAYDRMSPATAIAFFAPAPDAEAIASEALATTEAKAGLTKKLAIGITG
jgi:hypothetical protein